MNLMNEIKIDLNSNIENMYIDNKIEITFKSDDIFIKKTSSF